MASASARIFVTACALDGLAASAAAAAAALNASRRGTSVVGASMRFACSRVAGASMRVACDTVKRVAGVLGNVIRSRSPRIACKGAPRGAWSDATHAAHAAHRRRLGMIEKPKTDAIAISSLLILCKTYDQLFMIHRLVCEAGDAMPMPAS